MDHLMENLETFDHKTLSDQQVTDIERIDVPDFTAKQKPDQPKKERMTKSKKIVHDRGVRRETKIFYAPLPPDYSEQMKKENKVTEIEDSEESLNDESSEKKGQH